MKPVACCIILMSMVCILTSGCVSRTVTESKGTQTPNGANRTKTNSKVVEKKTIWFWQDGFRNPTK